MSRVAKSPVALPKGVEVTLGADSIRHGPGRLVALAVLGAQDRLRQDQRPPRPGTLRVAGVPRRPAHCPRRAPRARLPSPAPS